jgi:hypothetical protein
MIHLFFSWAVAFIITWMDECPTLVLIYFQLSLYAMVVDIMVPSHSVIRSHKKKIESSPSMIFPQGMK